VPIDTASPRYAETQKPRLSSPPKGPPWGPGNRSRIKDWFYPELAQALRGTAEEVAAFEKMLDSPLRIVLEITPEKWITYDGAKMRDHTQGTLDPARLAKPLESDAVRLQKEKAKRNLPND
jgi:hypothetical protein